MAHQDEPGGEPYLDVHPESDARKNRLDDRALDQTYLSRMIKEEVEGKIAIEDEEFTWVYPSRHGLDSWNNEESPVPLAVKQVGDLCILYQAFSIINLQLNVFEKLIPGYVVPQISFPYLHMIFEKLEDVDKTIYDFLHHLHHDGFVTTQDFWGDGDIPENASRYYLHFGEGFGRNTPDFQNRLKRCILYRGGVLAEIIMREHFDPAGDSVGPVQREKVKLPKGTKGRKKTIERDRGHAAVLVG